MRRALHQLVDRPVVFPDELALRILGKDAMRGLEEDEDDPRAPVATHLRAFLAARSRIAEDTLEEALTRGVTQYVVLGAGLDTWAARHPRTAIRVFEVDHPETQGWKRTLLADADLALPESLRFVPVDLGAEDPRAKLVAAGFDPHVPAAFSCLGLTPYLEVEAVLAILRFVGGCAAGTSLVLDYAVSPHTLGLIGRMVYRRFAERVAAAGEPWLSSFEPREMDRHLGALGFSRRHEWGKAEINATWFKDRADRLKVGSLARIVVAEVGTPED